MIAELVHLIGLVLRVFFAVIGLCLVLPKILFGHHRMRWILLLSAVAVLLRRTRPSGGRIRRPVVPGVIDI